MHNPKYQNSRTDSINRAISESPSKAGKPEIRSPPRQISNLSNKVVTFEEIHKLSYKQIFKNKDEFKPSDIIDMTEDVSDDEILSKFKNISKRNGRYVKKGSVDVPLGQPIKPKLTIDNLKVINEDSYNPSLAQGR